MTGIPYSLPDSFSPIKVPNDGDYFAQTKLMVIVTIDCEYHVMNRYVTCGPRNHAALYFRKRK